MSKRSVAITVLLALLAVLWFVWQAPQLLRAQRPADKTSGVSCAQYIAPKRNINGKMVGEEECLMLDRGTVDPNRKLHRIDMGFSGTLSGYIVKQGPRPNNFTSAPDFTFTQVGNHSPRFQAVLKYEAAKGTAVNLMYPETGWNGKLFVMVHGRDGSFMKGTLRAWDKYFDPGKPLDATKCEQSMLDRGYAVARTWRNADGFAPGDFSAVLEDGTTWPDLNVNIVPELILDELRAVDNLLRRSAWAGGQRETIGTVIQPAPKWAWQ